MSLPFGYGRRMCIGRRFAENELHILVAKVIRQSVSMEMSKQKSAIFIFCSRAISSFFESTKSNITTVN